MLYLQEPTTEQLNSYANSLLDNVRAKLGNSGLPMAIRNHLTKSKISEILIAEPKYLIPLHEELMVLIHPGYNEADYFSYVDQRNDANLPPNLEIYRPSEELFNVFNYKEFLSQSKKKSYDLATTLNRNTCTYCNRLYTNTVEYKDPKTGRVNNSTRITRPQFDHWYAQTAYPLLGLSFFNLIPSCSVCNSSIKGDDRFNLTDNIHPYLRDPKESFKFTFTPTNVAGKYQVDIKELIGQKISNHLTAFKIKEVYGVHSDFELQDLIDLKIKYSENYLDTLFNETLNHFQISKSEIYRMIFGVEIEENNFHRRPFSKFKTDIIDELRSYD